MYELPRNFQNLQQHHEEAVEGVNHARAAIETAKRAVSHFSDKVKDHQTAIKKKQAELSDLKKKATAGDDVATDIATVELDLFSLDKELKHARADEREHQTSVDSAIRSLEAADANLASVVARLEIVEMSDRIKHLEAEYVATYRDMTQQLRAMGESKFNRGLFFPSPDLRAVLREQGF